MGAICKRKVVIDFSLDFSLLKGKVPSVFPGWCVFDFMNSLSFTPYRSESQC